jgi:hypothetical protein
MLTKHQPPLMGQSFWAGRCHEGAENKAISNACEDREVQPVLTSTVILFFKNKFKNTHKILVD